MESSQPDAGNSSGAGRSGSRRGHAATGSGDAGNSNSNIFSGSYNTTPPLGPPQNPFTATNTNRSNQPAPSIAESGALPVPPKVSNRVHRHHPSYSNGSSNNTKKTVTSGGTAGTAVASASMSRPQPAVYWNDKKSMEQGRTFFNDDSPPPSPSLMGTTNKGSSIGHPSGKGPILSYGSGAGDYDYRYDHVAPPAPIPEKKKGFGLIPQKQKKWIWVVIGVLIVVILALAIGLGVGLSQNSSDGDSDNSSDQSSEEEESDRSGGDGKNSFPSTSVTVTGTSTIPITTSTTSTVPESQACPAANDTRFSVPNSEKTFLRICGIDYQGRGGTEELAIVWTASMQDCMVNCAGFDECTACSWGAVPGDSYRDNHRCYLKTNLGKRNKARPGWDFAMLVDDDD